MLNYIGIKGRRGTGAQGCVTQHCGLDAQSEE